MPYNWTYGVPLSGLQFPLVTASGTMAIGYNTAQLSGSISQNGLNWSGLTNSISGIPGNGVYSIASLTAVEMTCYTWAIKIVSNSGCLPQILLGVNASSGVFVSGLTNVLVAASGPHALTANTMAIVTSSMWNYVGGTSSRYVTGGDVNATALLTAQDKAEITSSVWAYAVSSSRWITGGIVNRVEAISGLVTLASQTHSGAILNQIVPVSGLANILSVCSGVPTGVWTEPAKTSISSIAQQVWNTVAADFTSGTTIGGGPQRVSGLINILTATSNVPNAIRDIDTKDATSLTSGTIAHDSRLTRWFTWENWKIDKTFTPDRLYLKSDATNYSSYWELGDTADDTTKTRGG